MQKSQENKQNNQTGFLIINKPPGPTSHDMVYKLRKITNIKKIGHAGTLDPFADGVLVMAIGRESTKKISQYVKLDKEYTATMKLGETSTTFDTEGEITKSRVVNRGLQNDKINKVLKKFTGPQKQIPPMFSAKKVKGKKLYALARQGIEIKREPSDIIIHSLENINYSWPILKIKVSCSTGTYIRTLAHDIGQALSCGAYLTKLQRTKIGNFSIEDGITLDKLNNKNWWEYLIN